MSRSLGRTDFKSGTGFSNISAGYTTFEFAFTQTGIANFIQYRRMPFACRVVETSTLNLSTSVITGTDYRISNRNVPYDVVQQRAIPAAYSGVPTTIPFNETITPTSSPVLGRFGPTVAATRDFANDDFLEVTLFVTTNSISAGGAIIIQVTVAIQGHVVADQRND